MIAARYATADAGVALFARVLTQGESRDGSLRISRPGGQTARVRAKFGILWEADSAPQVAEFLETRGRRTCVTVGAHSNRRIASLDRGRWVR